jgi:hypothetical protein
VLTIHRGVFASMLFATARLATSAAARIEVVDDEQHVVRR